MSQTNGNIHGTNETKTNTQRMSNGIFDMKTNELLRTGPVFKMNALHEIDGNMGVFIVV